MNINKFKKHNIFIKYCLHGMTQLQKVVRQIKNMINLLKILRMDRML